LAIADFVKYSLLEGLVNMISKDLDESSLNIRDKFFLREKFFSALILEEYLGAHQTYYNQSEWLTIRGGWMNIGYSWFTLLREGTVCKDLRSLTPETYPIHRQDYPGLRAGPLYKDEISRWLGIDNYLIRTSRRDNRSIADFEHFRFIICPSPVCLRNRL